MRLVASCALAVVVLAACGGIDEGSSPGAVATTDVQQESAVDSGPVGASTPPPTAESTTTRSPTPSLNEVDLVTYVATIESLLEGTKYAGRALAAPDVFLATGGLFCDQLDAGRSSDEVLTKYLETLTGGDVADASDDDLAMAGAVLGTGLVTMCPHHLAAFGASE